MTRTHDGCGVVEGDDLLARGWCGWKQRGSDWPAPINQPCMTSHQLRPEERWMHVLIQDTNDALVHPRMQTVSRVHQRASVLRCHALITPPPPPPPPCQHFPKTDPMSPQHNSRKASRTKSHFLLIWQRWVISQDAFRAQKASSCLLECRFLSSHVLLWWANGFRTTLI